MSPVQKHFISMRRLNQTMVGQKSIMDDISAKQVWNWGCVSAIDSNRRTIWIADAHRAEWRLASDAPKVPTGPKLQDIVM